MNTTIIFAAMVCCTILVLAIILAVLLWKWLLLTHPVSKPTSEAKPATQDDGKEKSKKRKHELRMKALDCIVKKEKMS